MYWTLILITGWCTISLPLLSNHTHFIKRKLFHDDNTSKLRNDNHYFDYPTIKTAVSLVAILSLTLILIASVPISSPHVADAQKGRIMKPPSGPSKPGGKLTEPITKIPTPEPKTDIQTKNSIIKEKIKNIKTSLKPSSETESVFRASNERIFRSLIDFTGIVAKLVLGLMQIQP